MINQGIGVSTYRRVMFAITIAACAMNIYPACAGQLVATLQTLHSFDGKDGAYPGTPLILDSSGTLFGVVGDGGINSNGTVFSISQDGDFKLLYRFTGGPLGSQPSGIWEYNGVVYGTTMMAGDNGFGTAFSISEKSNLLTIHAFNGGDGYEAGGPVAQSGGVFIGAAGFGGYFASCGTIYELTPAGITTVLYNFGCGWYDQSGPNGVLLGSDGNYYGTNYGSWFYGPQTQVGTIWRLTPSGTLTTLYTFTGGTDGGHPRSTPVLATDGNFYGDTHDGGASGCGVIYRITAAGDYSVIYSFTGGADGCAPVAALIQGKDGNVYGSTTTGGASGNGTLFSITSTGTLTTLHSFTGGIDGSSVYGALVEGEPGTFFGVAEGGGENRVGTVFKLTVN